MTRNGRAFLLGYIAFSTCMLSAVSTIMQNAEAVPVAPFLKEVSQPDGSLLKLKRLGDEWQNWYETEDGYTVIKDKDTGWWYYAEEGGENGIKKSSHAAGEVSPEELNVRKGLKPKKVRHPKQLNRR